MHKRGFFKMNIIETCLERIEDYRKTNKNPCKNYATKAAAEKATSNMAKKAAIYLTGRESEESANYVVFYVDAWGRWVGCIEISEVLRRKNAGGYVGCCAGFFTF